MHRVGTDGVLLGAWADATASKNILDVGTGTGLIALMLAQRTDEKTSITTLEPDPMAFDLARLNVSQSPFKGKITVLNTSLQNFKTAARFDLIVCNPPFFENSLKPPGRQRAQQRHSKSLPYQVRPCQCFHLTLLRTKSITTLLLFHDSKL